MRVDRVGPFIRAVPRHRADCAMIDSDQGAAVEGNDVFRYAFSKSVVQGVHVIRLWAASALWGRSLLCNTINVQNIYSFWKAITDRGYRSASIVVTGNFVWLRLVQPGQ